MMIIEACMNITYDNNHNNNKWMFHNFQVDDVKFSNNNQQIQGKEKK